jgi:hypothetical protein
MPLTREQYRFLNSRLEMLKTEKHNSARRNKVPMPSAVKRARAVLNRFDARCRKISDRAYKKISDQYASARQAILFKDAKEAQAVVEKFARFKP